MAALVSAAFAAGLLGSVHCVGMCGGVAAALGCASRGPALRRQALFNAGRVASYALVGAAAGALGGLATIAAPLYAMQAALLAAATILMVMLGLYVAGWGGALLRLETAGRGLWRRIEPLRRRLVPLDTDGKALAAGAVWGWLPCGLVYGALALALASASAGGGAAVMLAFGLGTLPAMLASGLAARKLLAFRTHPHVRRGAGLAIIAVALAGVLRLPEMSALLAAGWLCLSG